MNVPGWLALTASSKEELLEMAAKYIVDMGGLDAAEKTLKELAGVSLEKRAMWVFAEKFVEPAYDTAKWINPERKEEATAEPIKPPEVVKKPVPHKKPQKKREDRNTSGHKLAAVMALLLGVPLAAYLSQKSNINLKEDLSVSMSGASDAVRQRFRDMGVILKPGVSVEDTPFTQLVIPIANSVFMSVVHKMPTITSGTEGSHMKGSHHYTGEALDFRTRDLPYSDVRNIMTALRKELPEDFIVLYEADPPHIHVQQREVGIASAPENISRENPEEVSEGPAKNMLGTPPLHSREENAKIIRDWYKRPYRSNP